MSTIRWAVPLGWASVSAVLGWAWSLMPAYQSVIASKEAYLQLQGDSRMSEMPATQPRATRAAAPSLGLDDVVALVRWQGLLDRHRLSGWHGRSLPATTAHMGTPGEAETDPGLVWQLEGPATYAEGMALLQSLIKAFPHLLLLAVQARHEAGTEPLQWRFELRWSVLRWALALSWPSGWPTSVSRSIDPFASNNLLKVLRQHEYAGAGQSSADSSHPWPGYVLPGTSLRQLRLAGVLIQNDERQALVATRSANGPTTVGHSSGWHRLRVGQTVGLERARVLSIESEQVVLQSRVRGSGGLWAERQHRLVLSASAPEEGVDPERQP